MMRLALLLHVPPEHIIMTTGYFDATTGGAQGLRWGWHHPSAATKATVENIAKGVTASMIMYPQLSDVNYKEWKRTCVAPVGFV